MANLPWERASFVSLRERQEYEDQGYLGPPQNAWDGSYTIPDSGSSRVPGGSKATELRSCCCAGCLYVLPANLTLSFCMQDS